MYKIKCRIFTSAILYLSLWLVKALDYLLHQPCYAVIEGVQIVGPGPHDVTNFEFDLCSFFMHAAN